jgi:hypothetical protein
MPDNTTTEQNTPDTPLLDLWEEITMNKNTMDIHPNAIKHELNDNNPSIKDNKTKGIMRRAMATLIPPTTHYQLHINGGANMSFTNDASLLMNYRNIKRFPITGVSGAAPALYVTGVGYLPWRSHDDKTLLVKCYFSDHAAEMIISPTDIAINKYADYNAWSQHANIDEGCGYIAFHCRDSNRITKFDLTSQNSLWYYHAKGNSDFNTCRMLDADTGQPIPTCHRMTRATEHLLMHFRAACPGETTECELPKHVKDFPIIKRNSFFKCPFCGDAKCTYRHMERHKQPDTTSHTNDTKDKEILP